MLDIQYSDNRRTHRQYFRLVAKALTEPVVLAFSAMAAFVGTGAENAVPINQLLSSGAPDAFAGSLWFWTAVLSGFAAKALYDVGQYPTVLEEHSHRPEPRFRDRLRRLLPLVAAITGTVEFALT